MRYLFYVFSAYPWVGLLFGLATLVFSVWMIVDCIRNGRDYYWIWIILFFWGIGALIYFFVNVWDSSALENTFWRRHDQQKRIEELKAKIHHLDKGDHYAELGDVYREQKRWPQAQAAYEAALERDKELLDAQVHLGYVLLAQQQPQRAWELLAPVLQQKPDYESGELAWQAARCQVAMGNLPQARGLYEQLLTNHGYFEAHYEFAELLDRLGEEAASTAALKQLLFDAQHAPRFLQRRHRRWVRKARSVLRGRGVKAQTS